MSNFLNFEKKLYITRLYIEWFEVYENIKRNILVMKHFYY